MFSDGKLFTITKTEQNRQLPEVDLLKLITLEMFEMEKMNLLNCECVCKFVCTGNKKGRKQLIYSLMRLEVVENRGVEPLTFRLPV